MSKVLRSNLWAVGPAAIMAFTYQAAAQDKKRVPPEKWAACSSLKDEAACKAGKDCRWIVERKEEKGTVRHKAYCRSH